MPEHEEARAENRGESGVAQSRLVVTNFLQLTQKQLLTYLWDSAKNHGERERARRAAEGFHTDYKYALSEIRRKKDRRLCVCPFHFQHEQAICQDRQCSDAACNGEPLEIRTPDPLIKSQMLCLLS